MAGVNENWLMALSFALGLVLTLAFTARRVTREVPVSGSAPSAASDTGDTDDTVAAELAGGRPPAEAEAAETTAADAGPYGAGSAKAGPGGSGPAEWTIKGNADSMLYHTPDSPAYDATIAEVWFREEKAAEAAGFARWDSWKHRAEK